MDAEAAPVAVPPSADAVAACADADVPAAEVVEVAAARAVDSPWPSAERSKR